MLAAPQKQSVFPVTEQFCGSQENRKARMILFIVQTGSKARLGDAPPLKRVSAINGRMKSLGTAKWNEP